MSKSTKKETSAGLSAVKKPATRKTAAAKITPGKKPAAKRVTTPKSASVTARKSKAVTADEAKSSVSRPAKRPSRKAVVEPTGRELIRLSAEKAARYALEKKAVDVRLLDLNEITTMTDFFVIATGDSDRQVKAIAENVISEMRDTEGISPWRSEGWDGLQWVLIDFVDFVVHIFQTEARQYYNLERLWADSPSIEITDEPVVLKARIAKKSAAEKPAPKKRTRASAAGVRVISEFKEVRD